MLVYILSSIPGILKTKKKYSMINQQETGKKHSYCRLIFTQMISERNKTGKRNNLMYLVSFSSILHTNI
jgi:hypothetical protein